MLLVCIFFHLLVYICLKELCYLFILLDCAGVIDVLVSNGRQIDAVNLAFAFELTETYSPVSLLKSYLANAARVSSPVKSPNSTLTVQVFYVFLNSSKCI